MAILYIYREAIALLDFLFTTVSRVKGHLGGKIYFYKNESTKKAAKCPQTEIKDIRHGDFGKQIYCSAQVYVQHLQIAGI